MDHGCNLPGNAQENQRTVNQGASVVDMEASALMAWSKFRHADVCQFFYTADYVSQDGWDRRMDQRRRPLEDFLQIALLIASHC